METISLTLSDVLALTTILLLGVPHGASDLNLAIGGALIKSKRQVLIFGLSYVALTALFILVWIMLPVTSLIAFLAISVYHFGRADAVHYGGNNIDAFLYGGLPMLFIPLAHPNEVSALFTLLTFSNIEFLPSFYAIALLWGGYLFLRLIQDRVPLRAIREMLILSLAFIFLPPLWGFAVYFCGFHARRHFMRVRLELNIRRWRDWGVTAGLAAITLLAMVLAAPLASNYITLEVAFLRTLFIGLFALTIPHVMLIDAIDIFRRISPSRIDQEA